MDIRKITEQLTEGAGVSGNCHTLTKAKGLLEEYAEVRTDALGSIIGTVGSGKTHIMLDAHLDRIGLIVTAIDESGFLRVDKCGGSDTRVLCAAEVTVWGKEPVYGVITSTPPHLAKSEDASKAPSFDNIYVDTGLSYDKLLKIVSVGDRITIDAPVRSLAGSRITGAALDDRIGMAALLRVLDIIKGKNPAVKVSVLFSVQEETTEAGGKTGAFGISPDEAIVVDVSFATAPGISEQQAGKLGEGGMICISPSLSHEMSNELISLANENSIKYQTEICPSSTGTNADVISVSKSGIKTGLVSIPLRNMHTQAEIADLEDVESVAQIIAAYIIKKGAENND
ncbi:MAG: M42 family peptidase [Clostridia bacterium]|nr:M42 family peptidase [Clostridia bacterium]